MESSRALQRHLCSFFRLLRLASEWRDQEMDTKLNHMVPIMKGEENLLHLLVNPEHTPDVANMADNCLLRQHT